MIHLIGGGVFVLANSFISFSVVIYALYKKVAVVKTTKYDILFILFGIIGLVLWQIIGNPDLAIIFAILADFSFGMLTVIKTYRDPTSESKYSWLLAMVSDSFALLALSYISFTEVAYPIFLFFYDFLIFALVYKIIRKTTTKKENS